MGTSKENIGYVVSAPEAQQRGDERPLGGEEVLEPPTPPG